MESVANVIIHPVALLSIIDSYERRTEFGARVIGTLLGYTDSRNIHVTNSFAVPHTENESEVFMSIEFNQTMLSLNGKVNPSEKIVGWYSTGAEITAHSKLVHEDYFQKLCRKQCVFLLVDASVSQSVDVPIRAYTSRPIGVPGAAGGGKSSGVMFVPIEVRVEAREAERHALELMRDGLRNKRRHVFMRDDLSQLLAVSGGVLDMVTAVLEYVSGVVHKRVSPDPQVGRKLAQIVLAIPKIERHKLDELVSASTKDLLMYTYLCALIKTEMKITEKLLNAA